jgi:hypothetical protein
VKFDRTAEFADNWKTLPVEHRRKFRSMMPAFNASCEAYLKYPGGRWPAHLRVKPMVGVKGLWEMTWSFAGPDGRATFEFIEIDGEPAVRWRRIGGHDIYDHP